MVIPSLRPHTQSAGSESRMPNMAILIHLIQMYWLWSSSPSPATNTIKVTFRFWIHSLRFVKQKMSWIFILFGIRLAIESASSHWRSSLIRLWHGGGSWCKNYFHFSIFFLQKLHFRFSFCVNSVFNKTLPVCIWHWDDKIIWSPWIFICEGHHIFAFTHCANQAYKAYLKFQVVFVIW